MSLLQQTINTALTINCPPVSNISTYTSCDWPNVNNAFTTWECTCSYTEVVGSSGQCIKELYNCASVNTLNFQTLQFSDSSVNEVHQDLFTDTNGYAITMDLNNNTLEQVSMVAFDNMTMDELNLANNSISEIFAPDQGTNNSYSVYYMDISGNTALSNLSSITDTAFVNDINNGLMHLDVTGTLYANNFKQSLVDLQTWDAITTFSFAGTNDANNCCLYNAPRYQNLTLREKFYRNISSTTKSGSEITTSFLPTNVDIHQSASFGSRVFFAPKVVVGANVHVSSNSYIFFACTLDPGVKLGQNTHVGSFSKVHTNTTVGANTNIEENCDVGNNGSVGSNVNMGKGSGIGRNSSVGDNVFIGSNTTIGSNSILEDNVNIQADNNLGDFTFLGQFTVINGEYNQFLNDVKVNSNCRFISNNFVSNNVTFMNFSNVGIANYFGDFAVFGESSNIGSDNVFGINNTFGSGVSFKDSNDISENVKFDDSVGVGSNNTFEANTQIGSGVTFTNFNHIGAGSNFASNSATGTVTSVGSNNTFNFNVSVGANVNIGSNNYFGNGTTIMPGTNVGSNNNFSPNSVVANPTTTSSTLSTGAIVGIAVAGAVVLIVTLVIIYLCWRRYTRVMTNEEKMKKMKKQYEFADPASDKAMDLITDMRNQEGYLESSQFVILDELASGAFGVVSKGAVLHNGKMTICAIKELKNNATEAEARDLESEANMLKSLNHENVVRLIGISGPDPLYILLEYMDKGSLSTYLKQTPHISEDVKMWYAYQAARGLFYLADNNIIHRDVAARNVLLGSPENPENPYHTVKLADMGLARMTDDSHNYVKSDGGLVPIRWMAPESWPPSKVYTEKSDTWSFGILVWEIYNKGAIPYKNHTDANVLTLKTHLIEEDHRLSFPDDCSKAVINVISKCWSLTPSDRPNFKNLRSEFAILFKQASYKVHNVYEDIDCSIAMVDNLTIVEDKVQKKSQTDIVDGYMCFQDHSKNAVLGYTNVEENDGALEPVKKEGDNKNNTYCYIADSDLSNESRDNPGTYTYVDELAQSEEGLYEK